MKLADSEASPQRVFDSPLFAEFDLGLLDPGDQVIPLEVGSMVETRREPTWPDSTKDPRSLPIFLQRNLESESFRNEKRNLVARFEAEMRRPGRDAETLIPGLDLELRELFAGSLCPIYNDLAVVAASDAWLVTLLERKVRKVDVPLGVKSCVLGACAENERRLLVVVTVNLRRAVLCGGLGGYVRAMLDGGAIQERIKRHWSLLEDGLVCRTDGHVVHAINSAFGFSGYYYSAVAVMAGAIR